MTVGGASGNQDVQVDPGKIDLRQTVEWTAHFAKSTVLGALGRS
jgi:hypothetical protein